jgi:GNAT superfamily N-acetyltransferase
MTNPDLIAALDVNFYEGWRMMAAKAIDGITHEEDGVLITAPGVLPMWVNIVFVTQPLRDPERRLAEAFARLDERSIPFLVRIREGLDPDSERACERLGLRYTDSIPGMAFAPITPGRRDTPLDIRPVEDDAAFAHFVDIIGASFGIEPEAARRLLPAGLRHTPDTFWYVGYLDGEPVAASQVMLIAGAAGVNFIGTLEAHRGRGFGEAVTWEVVNKGAEQGCAVAVLQASEPGKPVYERMGFRTVTSYKTFVRPEWAG